MGPRAECDEGLLSRAGGNLCGDLTRMDGLTRDLARLEDGNLFIVGRTKELIVRFGFNVYPSELEAVQTLIRRSCGRP